MKKYYFDGREMNDGDVISYRKNGHYFVAILGTPEFEALTKELVENGILKVVDDTQEEFEESSKDNDYGSPLDAVSNLIAEGKEREAIELYKNTVYKNEVRVATSIVLSIIAMYDKEQEGM